MAGNLTLVNNALKGNGLTLQDDTATDATPTDVSGWVFIYTILYNEWAIMLYKVSTTNALSIALGGTNFTVSTGTTLTGTTGTDGKINISVNQATGKMYFENRLGAARSFRWLYIFGG